MGHWGAIRIAAMLVLAGAVAAPESDITDDIIKAYDQDSGKGKKP